MPHPTAPTSAPAPSARTTTATRRGRNQCQGDRDRPTNRKVGEAQPSSAYPLAPPRRLRITVQASSHHDSGSKACREGKTGNDRTRCIARRRRDTRPSARPRWRRPLPRARREGGTRRYRIVCAESSPSRLRLRARARDRVVVAAPPVVLAGKVGVALGHQEPAGVAKLHQLVEHRPSDVKVALLQRLFEVHPQ